MRNEEKIILLLIFLVPHLLYFAGVSAFGQPSETLDNYIKQGLRNNLALKQKELSLEKSLKALQEANGLFYPSVGLEAQYFLADGGRANRQYILSLKSIHKIHNYGHQKLKVTINPANSSEIIVSKLKAAQFKQWINR